MRIEDVTTRELRRALSATIRAVGPDSASVKLLRRELGRRAAAPKAVESKAAETALGPVGGGQGGGGARR